MKNHFKRIKEFILIGLFLYGIIYYVSEKLVYMSGHTNPIFKIKTTSQSSFDYVILGASRAMPFDFVDINTYMEEMSGTKIINLATPGGGIVYNRFILEYFSKKKETKNVLYIIDSFAFYSKEWNEGRFKDVKLIRRTPLDLSLANLLLSYIVKERVSFYVFLSYITGFSKINNHDRFEPDIWEGERKFNKKYRFSKIKDLKRIQYLYPSEKIDLEIFNAYLSKFISLIDLLESRNINLIVLKTPIPTHIYKLIPHEKQFDEKLIEILTEKGIDFYDFSLMNNNNEYFYDTDHLNRKGVITFFDSQLKDVLIKYSKQ